MIFEKLADTVVRHFKLILVIWIVALLYIAPAITKVDEVLVYQESEMVEGDMESLVAQGIINEQFPVALANSTLMIVVTGPNMSSELVRDFCLDLGDSATETGALAYLEDFSSVYSVYEGMIYAMASELGPALVETEYQVNLTASLLYGIPSMYVSNWVSTNSSLSIVERDYIAYQTTVAMLPYILESADEATALLSYQYFGAFTYEWNSTYDDPGLTADPQARAEAAVDASAPQLIAGLPYPDDQKVIMYAILASFDLTTFSNQTIIHSFSVTTVASIAGVTDLAFMEDLYALGPEFTPEELAGFSRSVVASDTLDELPVQLPPEYLSSFVSTDGTATLIIASFSKDSDFVQGDSKPIVDNVDALRDMVAQSSVLLTTEYETYVTGDAAITADMEESMGDELSLIEPVTIILIIVLMGIFFRSVVAQFLPLGGVMVALGVSQAFVFLVGSLIADI
ncbi:MAG: family transporter, partial [Candidatus Thermoplasmatota archaeon]|nr:family transporter [Candidatus Thermoplasmatota archaeon]